VATPNLKIDYIMKVEVYKNKFQKAKFVSWDDAIFKLNHDFKIENGCRGIMDFFNPQKPQSYVCKTNFYPNTIGYAYSEVETEYRIENMHTYISFLEDSHTFGMHKDTDNVLIVQSIGSIIYEIDNHGSYKLEPGDAITIPKGIEHAPVVLGPRVSLSYSVI